MKTLIIAEKPSLAREIKEMLTSGFGVEWESRGGEYYESQEYYLSSFFGHLLTQCEPADYDEKYKKWNREDLPIIPDKTAFKYKDDNKKRGKLLAKLSAASREIVNATDPDREGEGIFRIWYDFEKIELPIKRLWATSLAVQDLKKAWEKMKDGREYDNLAAAQRCRMEADWLVGMNGSRVYSIITNERLSVGRVQTPTLALIVKRDKEVEEYKESYSYGLTGSWTGLEFTYLEDKETSFETEEYVERVKRQCFGKKFSLKSFKKERKTKNPPKPFSMPDLQKEANKKFNFSLDKTLKIAQSLYESKIITYPRTDSPYLPPADIDKYYDIIDKLGNVDEKSLLILKGESVPCVKSTSSAHTAIIPTGEFVGAAGEDERNLYNLIVKRFVTAFLRPQIYDQSTVFITDGTREFRAIVNRIIEKGFTELLSSGKVESSSKSKVDDKAEAQDDEEQVDGQETAVDLEESLFQCAQEITSLNVQKKKKAKPKYYTPATLLTAMMNVGKTLESAEDREILKEVEGLGTAATRDKIPVELEKRGYIEKSGKNIKSTAKGREFIGIVKNDLKSAELTARWEQKLRMVEEGKYDAAVFKTEINSFVKEIVLISDTEAEKFQTILSATVNKYDCPKCTKKLRENNVGFFCEDKNCGFALWKEMNQKKIPRKEIEALLTKLESGKINGFKGVKGNDFAAKIVIKPPECKPKFIFDSPSLCDYSCPCCSQSLERSTKAISCKCGFILWLTMSEKTLSEPDIKALLTNGITGVVKGFKSTKTQKAFEAKLVVNPADKKVKFLFADKGNAKIAEKVSV